MPTTKPRATSTCQGCHRRATQQHAGCTCPVCGGAKHHQAERCQRCVGLVPVTPPKPPPTERIVDQWRLVCPLCSREREVTVQPGQRPPQMRCGPCGCVLLAEYAGWRVLMEAT